MWQSRGEWCIAAYVIPGAKQAKKPKRRIQRWAASEEEVKMKKADKMVEEYHGVHSALKAAKVTTKNCIMARQHKLHKQDVRQRKRAKLTASSHSTTTAAPVHDAMTAAEFAVAASAMGGAVEARLHAEQYQEGQQQAMSGSTGRGSLHDPKNKMLESLLEQCQVR
ncbi:unnamed protein product [Chrysoparadoxa australica]